MLAGGLRRLRYLLAEEVFSKLVIYEKRKSVGGTWNFTPLLPKPQVFPDVDSSEQSPPTANEVVTANISEINTPMYEHLEANLPHMLMRFADTPFPEKTQLFATRECTMQYLEEYASELSSIIRLEHEVTEAKMVTDKGSHGWSVTTKTPTQHEGITEHFDAMLVANGHCHRPLLPTIKGLDEWAQRFPESLHHSVSYKNAKAFEGKVSERFTSTLFPLFSLRAQELKKKTIVRRSLIYSPSASCLSGVAPPQQTLDSRSPASANSPSSQPGPQNLPIILTSRTSTRIQISSL